MRGFFMEQLRRGGVPTWMQIIAAVIFSIVGIIFVLGGPELLMGLLRAAIWMERNAGTIPN